MKVIVIKIDEDVIARSSPEGLSKMINDEVSRQAPGYSPKSINVIAGHRHTAIYVVAEAFAIQQPYIPYQPYSPNPLPPYPLPPYPWNPQIWCGANPAGDGTAVNPPRATTTEAPSAQTMPVPQGVSATPANKITSLFANSQVPTQAWATEVSKLKNFDNVIGK